MIFNSIDFILFFVIVFLLYWFVFRKNIRGQNVLIVISSYFFYGWWDWRFLSLIIFSTLVDFTVGNRLYKENNNKQRKTLLIISILVNLGFLGFFKYYNFFIDSFVQSFSFFGADLTIKSLNIILPVGISFYTFQTLSYTIDVYKKRIKPSNDLIAFSAFVSFFPQLVAGPIERAKNMLPQFHKERFFDYQRAEAAFRLILWGLFMKVVIADRLAIYVNAVYNNVNEHSGSSLLLATLFFTFQIYCDFAGYSYIAIGLAKFLGFDLMTNFNRPYFSKTISEFWSRWHISLSTWFRDYLYVPLGGNRVSKYRWYFNLFIVFLVSGIWHGANWTFFVWGALNGLYLIFAIVSHKYRIRINQLLGLTKNNYIFNFIQIFTTFLLCVFAWIFFRANSLGDAFSIVEKISTDIPSKLFLKWDVFLAIAIGMSILLFKEIREEYLSKFNFFSFKNPVLRIVIYSCLICLIILLGVFDSGQFIYFQF